MKKQLTNTMIEIIEELGKIRIETIENISELKKELETAGYTTYLDASTDYLIFEKA